MSRNSELSSSPTLADVPENLLLPDKAAAKRIVDTLFDQFRAAAEVTLQMSPATQEGIGQVGIIDAGMLAAARAKYMEERSRGLHNNEFIEDGAQICGTQALIDYIRSLVEGLESPSEVVVTSEPSNKKLAWIKLDASFAMSGVTLNVLGQQDEIFKSESMAQIWTPSGKHGIKPAYFPYNDLVEARSLSGGKPGFHHNADFHYDEKSQDKRPALYKVLYDFSLSKTRR